MADSRLESDTVIIVPYTMCAGCPTVLTPVRDDRLLGYQLPAGSPEQPVVARCEEIVLSLTKGSDTLGFLAGSKKPKIWSSWTTLQAWPWPRRRLD